MQADPPPPEASNDPVVRTIESEGNRWIVQEAGATRSGSGSDRGAPLLFLRFEMVDAPSPTVREGLAVASSLEDLNDDDLLDLFLRSRLARGPGPAPSTPPSGQVESTDSPN